MRDETRGKGQFALHTTDGAVLRAVAHGKTAEDLAWLASPEPCDPPQPAGPERSVPVLLPALGTPARAYRHLGSALAREGMPTLSVDLRGAFTDGPRPSRTNDWGFDAHLRSDLDTIEHWLEQRGAHPIWIGHSYGGHLAAARVSEDGGCARAVVMLATSELGFRHWGAAAPAILAATQSFDLAARVLGRFPGRAVGWGGDVARGVIRDWARWARSGRFRGSDGRDLGVRLRAIEVPVLSVSFADDHLMGRRSAVDAFAARFAPGICERWHLTAREVKADGSEHRRVGHFGFLRDAEPFWQRLAGWLQERPTGARG